MDMLHLKDINQCICLKLFHAHAVLNVLNNKPFPVSLLYKLPLIYIYNSC